MEKNIKSLKSETNNLKYLFEKYQVAHLNYYNTLLQLNNYWKDNDSEKYLTNSKYEKNKSIQTINYIKELIDIYDFIIIEYEQSIKNAKINYDKKDAVLEKIDIINKLLDEFKKNINNIELIGIDKKDIDFIDIEKTKIINTINLETNLTNKIKNDFDTIDNIDRKVNRKISSLNFTLINKE